MKIQWRPLSPGNNRRTVHGGLCVMMAGRLRRVICADRPVGAAVKHVFLRFPQADFVFQAFFLLKFNSCLYGCVRIDSLFFLRCWEVFSTSFLGVLLVFCILGCVCLSLLWLCLSLSLSLLCLSSVSLSLSLAVSCMYVIYPFLFLHALLSHFPSSELLTSVTLCLLMFLFSLHPCLSF